MSDLRSVVRSLTPEEKQRLREGLRSVEERLVSLTERPEPEKQNPPCGGSVKQVVKVSP